MKKALITSLILALVVWMIAFIQKPQGYVPGDIAANFTLKNVNGSMVSLANDTDKGAIIVFTCNHCPYAKMYEDRIIALDNMYRSKGYPVIAINPNDPTIEPDDSFDNMVKRAKAKKYPFPYLFDETQETAKTYGATKTPHVYVVQKVKSDYVVQYIGAIDDNSSNASAVTQKYVENAVNELLAGKSVTVNTTKAIGCGIKWKK